MKPLTSSAIMNRKFSANKSLIIEATGIPLGMYNRHVYDAARAWIMLMIWNDEELVQRMTEQPEFWAWWVNQWNQREDQFVTGYVEFFISSDNFSTFLSTQWLKIHEVEALKMEAPKEVIQNAIKALRGTGKGASHV